MKVVTLDSIVSVIRARRGYKKFLSEFINECKIVDATIIPDNATNGEVIMAMFPDAEVVEVKYYDGIVSHYQVDFGEVNGNQNIVNFKADLWNAPYKKGTEE